VTTPPQRPGQPGWRGRQNPPDPVTRQLPRPPGPEAPTEQLRARQRPTDAAPTERIRRPPPPPGFPPAGGPPPPPPPPRPPAPVVRDRPQPEKPKRRLRDPLSLFLIAIIVIALLAGGLAGAELYARHRADGILVAVAECVVQDGAEISFGVNPPFLWQHITGHYTNITVTTAGNQVRDAKGMTADVSLHDVRLQDSADSKGTIGSLNATLSWKSDGIKDTVVANLPVVGNLVTGVSTDPAAGTIKLEAAGNDVTAKPVVTNGNLELQVVAVDGALAQDTVQTALDQLTTKLNKNYPLGIHADSVEVTASGVVGQFSAQNASIPKEDADPCFARL
jgi:LmeA-like phospholipid-binding